MKHIFLFISAGLFIAACNTSQKETEKSVEKISILQDKSTVWYLITPTDSVEVSLDLCGDGEHFLLIEELKDSTLQIRYVAGGYYSEFPISDVRGDQEKLVLELTDSKGITFNMQVNISSEGFIDFENVQEFARDNLVFNPLQYPSMENVKYVGLYQVDNYRRLKSNCE